MIFVKFYIGDWDKSTKYLSAEEKGVYIDLLMLYYSRCERISERICERIRNAYTDSERKALDYVLETFFVKDGDSYVNERCEQEISSQKEKSLKAHQSASARWRNRDANASKTHMQTDMQTSCERNASHSQSQNIKESKKKSSPVEAERPSDVSLETWNALIEQQHSYSKKKLYVTPYRLDGWRREGVKVGLTLQEVCHQIAMHDWEGFTAANHQKFSGTTSTASKPNNDCSDIPEIFRVKRPKKVEQDEEIPPWFGNVVENFA